MMILATLCYIKHDGCTLMVHRNKKVDDIHKGKWNGLGGKVGKPPQECVIREAKFFSATFEYEGDEMRGYDVIFRS